MKIIPTDTYLNGIYPSNNLYLDVFDFWQTLGGAPSRLPYLTTLEGTLIVRCQVGKCLSTSFFSPSYYPPFFFLRSGNIKINSCFLLGEVRQEIEIQHICACNE